MNKYKDPALPFTREVFILDPDRMTTKEKNHIKPLTVARAKRALRKFASKKRAETNQYFFKTGPGEYGESDKFIGVRAADLRATAKMFKELSSKETLTLLNSKIHEERSLAVLILVEQFQSGDDAQKKAVCDLYISNSKMINNWDLVDCSAHKIVGVYLEDRPRKILYKLAKSKDLWTKRISIISTFHFIRQNDFKDTLAISEIHLNHEHDLMHKAVGWMLREVGKRNKSVEEKFLKKHYKKMPRTMLRYSIEKFPEKERQKYLKGLI